MIQLRTSAVAVILAAALTLNAGAPGLAVSAPAAATPPIADQVLESTLWDGDLAAARRIAADPRRSRAERALAQAALACWLRQDGEAGAGLTHSAQDRSLTESTRRAASVMLSGLRLRQGRYGDAVAALDAALPGITDAERRADLQQTRAFAAALVGVPPMTARVSGPGSIPLTRDVAGLNRGSLTINGGAVEAIIDTGSGVSTVNESTARRLGLRLLDRQVSVGTATADSALAKLAVADHLTFGGAQFRNVVFLVMPDQALSFANGAYIIQAIIGLPILLELGRLNYATTAGAESLSFGRSGAHPAADANLMLEADEPFAVVQLEGSPAPVRLFIDNGANTSHLNRRFAAEFPAIVAGARRQSVTRTGGAGSETQDAMRLPRLVLMVGATSAAINNLDVIDDHHSDYHGSIGLDALRSAPGYVLDFERMTFELSPAPAQRSPAAANRSGR